MPVNRLKTALEKELKELRETGRDKGAEMVITDVIKPEGKFGTPFLHQRSWR